jgi:hypothetical protein
MVSEKPALSSGAVRSNRGVGLAAVCFFCLTCQGNGATLSFAFSFGGSDTDRIFAVATDAEQNIYVAGDTASSDFPGAIRSAASSTVAFVAKFNPTGTERLYTVILGGANGDSARGIAVDQNGNAYVTGFTGSSNFPVTAGALQALKGLQNAFVAKLSPTGALLYSTYLGGSSTDMGLAIAVDQTGAAYIAGLTSSVNFPVTTGAPQGSFQGGAADCFVAKLNPAGSALSYSTYLGGSNLDECAGIAVDTTGAAFVTGTTMSANFPMAAALQPALASTYSPDAFLTKVSPAGTSFVFSTYIGGEGVDNGNTVQLDSSDNAYVGGATSSTLFPVTSGAFQSQLLGTYNGFLCKVASNGSEILYGTYLGGSGVDSITSLFVDSSGNMVTAGFTTSSNFPTVAPIQAAFGGDVDAFVAVFPTAGTSLEFASYIGGAGDDRAYGIAAGVSGTLIVAGQVMSGSVSYILPRFSSPPADQTDGFVASIIYSAPQIVPTLVSLSPASGTGSSQAFTAVYSSPAGGGDVDAAEVLFNTSFTFPHSCYVLYTNGLLYLLNDAATAFLSGLSPGSGSSSNSQCTLLGAGSSVSVSGNQSTLVFNIQFLAAFAGQKTVWTNAYSASSGLGSPWPSTQTFSWTVGTASAIVPALVSFSPASGTGSSQAFTAVYSSSAGGGDINAAEVLFNTSFAFPHSCYVLYSNGQFLLLDDAGTAYLPGISPGAGSSTNSQCTLLGAGSSVSVSGNQSTLVFNIQFLAAFAGQKTVWTNAYSASSGLGSPWPSTQTFSWTVGTASAIVPALVSFSPASGTGSSQAFSAVYSSPAGGGDIDAAEVLFNTSFAFPHSCYVLYTNGLFYLLNDAATAFLTGLSPGSGSSSNSQCTLLGAGSSVSVSGNQSTLVFNIQFLAAFAGQKTVWTNGYSASSGLGSPWPSTQTFSWIP